MRCNRRWGFSLKTRIMVVAVAILLLGIWSLALYVRYRLSMERSVVAAAMGITLVTAVMLGWMLQRSLQPLFATVKDLRQREAALRQSENRILVSQGLARMRAGQLCPGLQALFRCAGRDPNTASTFDLGFALGPRLNAAGRLADMSLGIECLTTDDPARALNIAQELDALNRERRTIEADMREDADLLLQKLDAENCSSLTLFDPSWHQGVIGILAGRIKEQLHRPTFAFARADSEDKSDDYRGDLRGSGRSIPGLHLRDALDLVSKRHPTLLKRFGGHAAAAGVTIAEADFAQFAEALETVTRELISPFDLTRTLVTDGELESAYCSLDSVRLMQAQVWGQGFAQPLFVDVFNVDRQRILKEAHLKLDLVKGASRFEAIRFNFADVVPDRIRAAYRLSINEFNGRQSVQLMLEHIEPA